MVTAERTLNHDIGRALLRGVIAIVGLLIIRFVVSRLPMVAQAEPIIIDQRGYDFASIAPLDIARAVVDVLICIVIIFTATSLGRVLRAHPTQASNMGPMLLFVALLVVVALLYGSLMGVVVPLIGQQTYGWIFLGLGILALAGLILTAYANLDVITELAFQGSRHAVKAAASMPMQRPAPPPMPTSAAGPAQVPPAAGANVSGAAAATNCAGCNSPLKPGARFCSSCGRQVTSETVAAPVVCPSCGASNPPGSRFCGSCAKAIPSP